MKFLISYLKPFKGRMMIGLAIKICATLFELLLPLILTHILDTVIATMDVYRIIGYGVLMLCCSAVACALNIIANRKAARVSMEFSRKMRSDLFRHTLYLRAEDTDRFTVPSLESRITSDTYNIHSFVGVMQRMGVRAPIMLVGGMLISFVMDAYLALVMLAMLPLIFGIIYFISSKGVPLYRKVQDSVDGMIRVVRENTQGIRVIKALSKEGFENERYEKVNQALSKDERRAGTIMGSVNPLMTLLMNLGICAVVLISANRVSLGESSPATVIAFMQYFTLISMAMMSLSRIFVMYTKCAASSARIAEILNTENGIHKLPEGEKSHTGAIIEFKKVSFSYFGVKNNLDNISFAVMPGENLGIIGATGSGKSTLVKLLLRFYDAGSGEIYLLGRRIEEYDRAELASIIGVALQSDFLYSESIAENIDFGRELGIERIKWAAQIAQADSFIEADEEGYDKILSPKGTNLSGGQRQRLVLARALAASPKILILDDSSSALDYKTDSQLRRAIREKLQQSTVVTVAQRVSSIKDCEHILVLDEGGVIGYGTHEELLSECTEYKEISESQMGGAIIE